jgi:hypothetical protein
MEPIVQFPYTPYGGQYYVPNNQNTNYNQQRCCDHGIKSNNDIAKDYDKLLDISAVAFGNKYTLEDIVNKLDKIEKKVNSLYYNNSNRQPSRRSFDSFASSMDPYRSFDSPSSSLYSKSLFDQHSIDKKKPYGGSKSRRTHKDHMKKSTKSAQNDSNSQQQNPQSFDNILGNVFSSILGSPPPSLVFRIGDMKMGENGKVGVPHNDLTIDEDVEEGEATDYDSDDEYEELDVKIETIDDLIKLGEMYDTLVPKKLDGVDGEKEEKEKKEKDKKEEITQINKVNKTKKKTKNKLPTIEEDEEDDAEITELEEDDDDDSNDSDDEDITQLEEETISIKMEGKKLFDKTGSGEFTLESAYSFPKPKLTRKVQSFYDPFSMQIPDTLNEDNKCDDKKEEVTQLEKDNKEPKEKPKGFMINGKRYSIDLETLNKLVKPLKRLKNMVGLEQVKKSIVNQIIYFVQKFERNNRDMLHTVIEGPPGVGKTELGKILAMIYLKMGIINKNVFKIVKRSDLVGEYLGHTATKTQKVIDEAEGGVLFIDEAYSLGNKEKKDSFAKECIDTINQNLSDKKKNFVCIIAGYPEELNKCFFSYNPGLKRRFPFTYKIDSYTPEQLRDIFLKKVNDIKWKPQFSDENKDEFAKFFKDNKDHFPHYGGDMETLLLNCKISHSNRVVGKHPKNRKKLTKEDIHKGFDRFMEYKRKLEEKQDAPLGMYI